jgi:hypothetical protein
METRMTIKFSDITGGGIPYGNNAGRPANPGIGKLYSNGETARLELFTGAGSWENIVQEVPGVSSISGNYSEATNSGVITIYGTNFVSGAYATAIGANGVQINAQSTVYNSLVQLTATFTGLSNAQEPYDIKVTNPSNLFGLIPDALYINASPVWVTSSGSLGTFGEQVSITLSALSATDSDSATITYALASGSTLPSGVTLNSSSGVISGTLPDIAISTTYNFTINASDGLNVIPRTFSITSLPVTSSVELLVVGGGGGGGSQVGGGGGAGGLLYASSYSLPSTSISLTVGAGGAGNANSIPGSYGSNSFFGSLIAIGGGGGGAHMTSSRPASGDDGITGGFGRPGGSGGGGGGDQSSIGRPGGSATQTSYAGVLSYGNGGGTGFGTNWAGGGGGGAGSAGTNAAASTGGVGGNGREYSITGTAQFYAAGGGGCYNNAGGTTGRASGVGGAGNGDTPNADREGVANTGSGGGGVRDVGSSGQGGSGIVIIAYPDTFAPIKTIPGTLTYNQPTRAGHRVYRFTAGSGTITF